MWQDSEEESSSNGASSDDEKADHKSKKHIKDGSSSKSRSKKEKIKEAKGIAPQNEVTAEVKEELTRCKSEETGDLEQKDKECSPKTTDENDAVNEDESSSAKGESDTDYDAEEKGNDSDEDDEEGNSASEDNDSSSGESSDSTSKARVKPKRPSNKIDEKTRKLLESENLLRRSSRARPSRRSSPEEGSDEEAASTSEWSEDERPARRRSDTRKTKKAKQREPPVKQTRGKQHKRGQYRESSDDEDFNESDVLEWDETPVESTVAVPTETIEKVLKTRTGILGAVGSATTCYNIADKGDPNEAEGPRSEQQFLIKWVGWSHLHNTWESEASLKTMNASGLKKLQNYMKRMSEIDDMRKHMDKEYIEFFECEQAMSEDLYEEYKQVERVVAHQVSRDTAPGGTEATEFFAKWSGLPYAECTWEEQRLLPQQKIDEYFYRIKNLKSPHKSQTYKKRPKFVKLEEMPDYLRSPYNDSELRDYQLMGLNWMLHAWCKSNSCILADEMGLGKTIQSISFVASLFHHYQIYGPFLVVVPLSTMSAWQKEFQQWAPDINMVTYMGDVSSRDMIRQYEWFIGGTKRLKVNAVLTTFEILLKDKSFLGGVQWAALLVDEAHRLKNDDSLLYKCLSTFHCDHRLLITGTPLQNSLKELWALLHFIMPEDFSSWEEFEEDYKDTDHKGISSLHKRLEPFLLRRVKKDVEKSLPAKVEQILRVDMTAQQKQYYKWILTKNYRELSKGVKGSINGFVNLIMELKKCCNHTSLVRQYDFFEDDVQSRLQQLLKSSGKLILLDKLLVRLKETGHRVLIFSQMVMMLDVIQEYLQLRRFTTQRLDGSMRADLRKAALDHFNAEGSTDFCFLLSTRAGGLGINLATADTVIIFDSDWNPQNDLQAMSRAHRIGQTKKVNIYRLVTKGSVEEQIVERAKQKLVLDHLVIQRMDTTGRTVLSKSSATGSVPFDKSDLNDILKFGAAELFKENEGEEQEPEVDIDRILMGAETRECEDAHAHDNELLSAFKYANFAIDEEKDLEMAAAANQKEEASWDDIIPEEERKKIDEDERRKELESLNLGPRQRTKVNDSEEADGDNGEESDESSESAAGGGRKKRRKAFGAFSIVEIKRFVRSFKKFAQPLKRLEAIAQDAELEEHTTEELHKLGAAILEECLRVQEEHEKEKTKDGGEGAVGEKPSVDEEASRDGGESREPPSKEGEPSAKRGRTAAPQFKFAGVVDINVRSVLKGQQDLEPLHAAMASFDKESDFRVPSNLRPQKGWDVPWGAADDAALLRGVYKYGMGSWDAVKLDPDLGLADKVFLKDKVKKPQPKHLQQRVDYLMKLLKTGKSRKVRKDKKDRPSFGKKEANKEKESEADLKKERKRKADDTSKLKKKKPRESKEKAAPVERKEKEHHHHHHHKDQARDNGEANAFVADVDAILQRLVIKKELYGHALDETSDKSFRECVKEMTSAQKYIKKLSGEHSSKDEAKYLPRLGDCIRNAVVDKAKKKQTTKHVERHCNWLWIFLSKFIPQEPAELLEKYRMMTANGSKHKHKAGASLSPKNEHADKDAKTLEQKDRDVSDHPHGYQRDVHNHTDSILKEEPVKEREQPTVPVVDQSPSQVQNQHPTNSSGPHSFRSGNEKDHHERESRWDREKGRDREQQRDWQPRDGEYRRRDYRSSGASSGGFRDRDERRDRDRDRGGDRDRDYRSGGNAWRQPSGSSSNWHSPPKRPRYDRPPPNGPPPNSTPNMWSRPPPFPPRVPPPPSFGTRPSSGGSSWKNDQRSPQKFSSPVQNDPRLLPMGNNSSSPMKAPAGSS